MPEPLLNPWQRIVAEHYDDRELADVTDSTDATELADFLQVCGDGLFRFLMVELSTKEDCESLTEARERIATAIRQLQEIDAALANEEAS